MMDIADRIQRSRKAKGMSQEALADLLGVSRQAVSKWESGQSIPDMEKIILLSDHFGTTTDFLLKGISPADEPEKKCSAMIFSIIATILNAAGLVISIAIWIEWQTIFAVGTGIIIMLAGTGIFLAGQAIDAKDKPGALRFFILPGVWILLLIPLSCCFNILDGLFGGYSGMPAPIPLSGNSFWTFGLCWMAYLTICAAVDISIVRASKKNA